MPAVAADGRAYLFGHLGDGNVNVNLLGDAPDDGAVLELALELGGTISAEHGVGVAKAAGSSARGARPRSPPCARIIAPLTPGGY